MRFHSGWVRIFIAVKKGVLHSIVSRPGTTCRSHISGMCDHEFLNFRVLLGVLSAEGQFDIFLSFSRIRSKMEHVLMRLPRSSGLPESSEERREVVGSRSLFRPGGRKKEGARNPRRGG